MIARVPAGEDGWWCAQARVSRRGGFADGARRPAKGSAVGARRPARIGSLGGHDCSGAVSAVANALTTQIFWCCQTLSFACFSLPFAFVVDYDVAQRCCRSSSPC